MKGEKLSKYTKGCKHVAISPVPWAYIGFDELHTDLNMCALFIKIAKRIMTYCEEGDTTVPANISWRVDDEHREKENNANIKWMMNDKEVTGTSIKFLSNFLNLSF